MSATAEALAEVPLFAGLDDNERALLAERVDLCTITEGEKLFEYGDPGDWMMIIKTGQVEISVRTKTGEKVYLETAEPGDFFGEISLLDIGPRTASAHVTKSGEAIVVDREDLHELLKIKPSAALHLLAATGKRLRVNAKVLRNTASRNVNEEVAAKSNVILRMADWVANFSGSLTFLVLHVVFFTAWLGWNSTGAAFDPFPYNLLTMTVSLEAIMLSTLILFSSNREGAREKVRSNIEYEVNLKAELQIQHLHEKVDQIHREVLQRLDALDRNKHPPGWTPPKTPDMPPDVTG